jgi:hypothetical protein
MTMTEPIPDLQWGAGNWVDYENNWREKDAEWLQARSILRFQTAAARDTALGAGAAGQVVYNDAVDRLELRSKAGPWVRLTPMPANLVATADSAAAVSLAHQAAGGKGISFTPDDIRVTGPFDVLAGTFKVATTGVTIKTGATIAVLTTDDTSLVSDKPLKTPSLTLTGTGVVLDATGKEIRAGTLTVSQVAASNINMSGTLTGGVISGASGTLGGVKVGVVANQVEASAGLLSQGALFRGDGAKAITEFPGKTGRVEVSERVGLFGDVVDLNTDMAVRNKAISWYDSTGTLRGNYAISVYSTTDPGATNFPEGTIWFS